MLSAEHEDFRDSVRRMAAERVAPIADELDRTDRFPEHLVEVFGDMGLLQLAVPEEYGGPGADLIATCIAREEVARAGSMALAQLAGQTGIVVQGLLDSAGEELKRQVLPELAEGRTLTCIALTESDVGSDPALLTTRAVRDGSDWVINGSKQFITWGRVARYALVFARTNDRPRAAGVTAFLADTDQPGWVVARENDKMGQRGVPNNEIFLDGLRVPDHMRVGDEGRGFSAALRGLHLNRPTVAALAVGGAQCALDYAVRYGAGRRTGGHLVTDYQGIQWMIARAATRIEAARSLVYRCALEHAGGADHRELTRLSSMAKLFATDVAQQVTYDALQMLGGHGYMRDHPVERYARDARILTIYEGTNEIQKNIIARHELRDFVKERPA
ncbi:acyl-CoA dehydrogenase [Pseudonocardia eucalypti]|uniref:Acyl-CoA dehydrogenase n=1 Tax=Pseudonocardia eucalypti TaxID=648755 RepID=A0ABP9PWZ3_9PSEU|nr:acyl-CoA dehydrogenase [Pseudonocardia eucalypti]